MIKSFWIFKFLYTTWKSWKYQWKHFLFLLQTCKINANFHLTNN